MPHTISKILFLVVLFLLAACGSAPIVLTHLEVEKNDTCLEQRSPIPYQICVYDEHSNNPDILYYLHGSGDWVHSFTKKTATDGSFERRQEWLSGMRKHWGVPRIIVISMGRIFLLNEKRLEVFRQIMANVESDLKPFRRRLLFGFSMGGHNALRLLLNFPNLFDRAAIAAPNLPLCDPFLGKTGLYLCYYKNPDKEFKKKLSPGLGLAASFQVKDSYGKNEFTLANPLAMAEALTVKLPPLFLTVGNKDQFGFRDGTALLVEILKAKHQNIVYREVEGGRHNDFPAGEIADFLSR